MRLLKYVGYAVVTSNETIILKSETGRQATYSLLKLSFAHLPCKSTNCRPYNNKATNNGVIVMLRSEPCSCWLANEEKKSRSTENCVVAALVFLCVYAFWIWPI